jgi:hypothetical protein
MKTLMLVLTIVGLLIGLTSVCMAEDWYAGMEKSSNDYRGSVGAMVAEVDGSKYTPDYTSAELKDTRAAADTRQFAQSGAAGARIAPAGNSYFPASTSGGPIANMPPLPGGGYNKGTPSTNVVEIIGPTPDPRPGPSN